MAIIALVLIMVMEVIVLLMPHSRPTPSLNMSEVSTIVTPSTTAQVYLHNDTNTLCNATKYANGTAVNQSTAAWCKLCNDCLVT